MKEREERKKRERERERERVQGKKEKGKINKEGQRLSEGNIKKAREPIISKTLPAKLKSPTTSNVLLLSSF